MKVMRRALAALMLPLALLAGGLTTASTAHAEDVKWSALSWQNWEGNKQSCTDAVECAYAIMYDINLTTFADGSHNGPWGDQREHFASEAAAEAQLWQLISVWDDAQAALVPYNNWYGEWMRVEATEKRSFGATKLAKWFLDKAQSNISVMFDPTTHAYIGPPPAASAPPEPTPTPTSPPTVKSFTKTVAPKISGTVKVGKKLKATSNSSKWSPRPSSVTYQWYQNGVEIPGATKSSYKLVGADARTKITVTVTGSRAGCTTASRTSKATKSVKLGTMSKGKVKVVGTTKVGKTLTAKTTRWSKGVTFIYKWYRNGHRITGAAARTYTLTAADKGKRIRAKVTAVKTGYGSKSRTSKPTKKVRPGVVVTPAPIPPTPMPSPTPTPTPVG